MTDSDEGTVTVGRTFLHNDVAGAGRGVHGVGFGLGTGSGNCVVPSTLILGTDKFPALRNRFSSFSPTRYMTERTATIFFKSEDNKNSFSRDQMIRSNNASCASGILAICTKRP